MDYITKTTTYTSFIPCPRELLSADLSATAKLAYLHLLERALLSKSNDWLDDEGHVYIVYPVEKLAAAMGKKRTTASNALRELDRHGLIVRKKQGFNDPNFIFVKMPNIENGDSTASDFPNTECAEKRTSNVQKSERQAFRKPYPNYNKNSYNEKSYNKNRSNAPQKKCESGYHSTAKNFDLTERLKELGIIPN